VEARKKKPIDTAKELADLVAKVKWRRGRIHPATKTFQAIRIETNQELENLKTGVESAIEMLNPKGRIGVISFHSLEDRIMKETFRNSPVLTVLTKKPIRPERKEALTNPRSRSAKLRIAEKQ
jgi:16S rRNA (cytosine1402-N4)-methyltransferase